MSLITYEEAIKIISESGSSQRLGVETIPLNEITDRICAEEVTARMANQPFDNSAMDGFALRASDLANATNDNPVVLEVGGHLSAGGGMPHASLLRGQCFEIMTGAPLPPECDTVVPVELTQKEDNGSVKFTSSVAIGDHVRRRGEDFIVGDKVVDAGDSLTPGHILALATLGVSRVAIIKKPKVALLSTGLEIIDDLDAGLLPGKIYNSTGPYLNAMMSKMGMERILNASVADDVSVYKSKLLEAMQNECDIILSTGAVSAGVHDFVPEVLKELGAKILFHKIAIRPGKPILFAKFPNGGPFFFGLPGNPVSTAVGLRFLVQPLLREMQGLPPEEPIFAVLSDDYIKKKKELRFFLRGQINNQPDGRNTIYILPKQQSFMVSPFLTSNACVMIPENVSKESAGSPVTVYQ